MFSGDKNKYLIYYIKYYNEITFFFDTPIYFLVKCSNEKTKAKPK